MKLKGYHVGLFVLLGFCFGFAAKTCTNRPVDVVKVVRDTLYRYDTITRVEPVEIAVYNAGTIRAELKATRAALDSALAAVPDTVEKIDSVFVPVEVPIERREYGDSTYRAVVSGYNPRLEYLELYRRETTITETRTQAAPRWSLGVTAGPGLFVDMTGRATLGAGIVAGLQYRF